MSGVGVDIARLEALAEEAARAHGLRLYEVKLTSQRNRAVLRVTLDRAGEKGPGRGVTVEECANVSLELGQLLDAEEIVVHAYDLEVSSPGVERPLEAPRQFAWAVGEQVIVWTREGYQGPAEIEGLLESCEGEPAVLGLRLGPKIKVKKGQKPRVPPREAWERVEIKLEDVRKARTSFPTLWEFLES